MKVLVINAGSSSVKFTLYDELREALARGLVERIGLSDTRLHFQGPGGQRLERPVAVADTGAAVEVAMAQLTDPEHGAIAAAGQIGAVGHRLVHGGEKMVRPVRIDAAVKAVISDCISLAPLHNPPNLDGITACERHLPEVPQVAVFDTAFHASMPERAFLYGLPYRFYSEERIRRYGFHGTSHQYVARKATEWLDRRASDVKLIIAHLGNGCSISAVSGGRCIDTSMGMTPLGGLLMGTRCGDLDPAVVLHLMERHGLDARQIDKLLNEQSGLLGLAGIGSGDLRDILAACRQGNHQAEVAVDAFVYRIRKYIGAYSAALNGADAVVFTAGIGENAPDIRQRVCQGLEGLGIALDPRRNADARGKLARIQADHSRVEVLVVPTDEEREIARQTRELLEPPRERGPG